MIQISINQERDYSSIIILPMNKENLRPSSSRLSKNNHPTLGKDTACASKQYLTRPVTSRNECHDQYIRLIIASNADYFQNKLRVTAKGKAKDLRLKIPCCTGSTVYRKDFSEKQARYHQEALLKQQSADCIRTSNFAKQDHPDTTINDKTNYQKDFKRHPVPKTDSSRRLKRRMETATDEDKVPRFLETQNRTDFLNWAGKNYVPSMKPQEKSAVTNLPFEATTVYRAQFEGKPIAPTPLFTRESSFPKFGNVQMMMRSNYSCEFFVKKGQGMEANCKPKHVDATLCKQFKGTTEYKREFSQSRAPKGEEEERFRTIQDLQTLIIDL